MTLKAAIVIGDERTPAFGWCTAAFAFLYGAIAAVFYLVQPALHGQIFLGQAVLTISLGVTLCVLSAIDALTHRLPNALTLPLIVSGLAVAAASGIDRLAWMTLSAGLGWLSLFIVGRCYRQFRQRDGLGLGDAKLFAGAGAWLGMENLSATLLIACGAALLTVLATSLQDGGLDRYRRIAFGPFIALGLWVMWLGGLII